MFFCLSIVQVERISRDGQNPSIFSNLAVVAGQSWPGCFDPGCFLGLLFYLELAILRLGKPESTIAIEFLIFLVCGGRRGDMKLSKVAPEFRFPIPRGFSLCALPVSGAPMLLPPAVYGYLIFPPPLADPGKLNMVIFVLWEDEIAESCVMLGSYSLGLLSGGVPWS